MLALEEMLHEVWHDIELREPISSLGPLEVRASGILVRGDQTWLIDVEPVDLAHRVEVFRLRVGRQSADLEQSRWFPNERWRPAGELLAAFSSSSRRLSLRTARYATPEWERLGISQVLLDDALLLRDTSGQQAIVTPDVDQPGGLRIARGDDTGPSAPETQELRVI